MAYDYYANVKDDVLTYINDEIRPGEFWDRDELESHLNDTLWADDSVTGNCSGSYTFNSAKAKEYVMENPDLLREAYEEFDCKDRLGEDFIEENWESMDVTIRCYVLNSCINDALDKIDREQSDFYGVDREDENDEE